MNVEILLGSITQLQFSIQDSVTGLVRVEGIQELS